MYKHLGYINGIDLDEVRTAARFLYNFGHSPVLHWHDVAGYSITLERIAGDIKCTIIDIDHSQNTPGITEQLQEYIQRNLFTNKCAPGSEGEKWLKQ